MPKKSNTYFDDVIIIKHSHPFIHKFFMFLLYTLSIAVVIFVADVITSYIRYGKFSLNVFSNIKHNDIKTYYLVTLGSFDNIDEAKQRAAATHQAGAGSYIWQKDSLYFVVANVYFDKQDATNVSGGLSAYNSTIVEVTINKSRFDSNTLSNTFDIFDKAYLELYNTSLGMDKKEITYLMASNAITSLSSQVKVWRLDLSSQQGDNTKQLNALIKLEGVLEDMSLKVLNNDQASYLIKYAIIDTINIFSNLADSL